MIKQSLPAVSPVDGENLEEIKTMDKIVVIGYIDSEDKTTHDAFEAFAESQRDNYLFAEASDPAIAKVEGVEQPAFVLYKDFDEKKAVFDGEIDQQALLGWVKTASTPLVGEIGPETYSGYITVSGLPESSSQSKACSLKGGLVCPVPLINILEGRRSPRIHFRRNQGRAGTIDGGFQADRGEAQRLYQHRYY